MSNQTQKPSFDAIIDMAVTLCNQSDMPEANLLTMATSLLQEIHASWDAIPHTTKSIAIGVAAALMRDAVRSGEYQKAMDDFLQPNATRQ